NAGLSLRTRQLPFLQGAQHVRGKRDAAHAGLGFRVADFVITIGALADVQLASLQVNVSPPSQAPQLASAQAGKGRHQQEGAPPTVLCGVNQALNLVWSRNVAPYFKHTLFAWIPFDRHIARNM